MKKNIGNITKIILVYLLLTIFIITFFFIPKSGEENTSLLPKQTSNNEINTSLEALVIESSPDINFQETRNKYQNNDIIARLEIPNLFNILITQSTDNKYYLNHCLTKKKDTKGTEFMDYRNNIDSKQINIYGHNSRTYDIPFRKLENFLNKDYFNKNKYIILQTELEKRIYEITAIKEVKDNEHMQIKLQGSNYLKHLDKLVDNAYHYREIKYDENSNILVLQTCSYANKDSYYIIVAIEIN